MDGHFCAQSPDWNVDSYRTGPTSKPGRVSGISYTPAELIGINITIKNDC